MKTLVVFISIFCMNIGFASIDSLTSKEQLCYAKAMIGFDSVINSRLGLPPEHAVKLTGIETFQDKFYLESVLGAYLWEDSPHKYAVKVYTNCIKNINNITFDE